MRDSCTNQLGMEIYERSALLFHARQEKSGAYSGEQRTLEIVHNWLSLATGCYLPRTLMVGFILGNIVHLCVAHYQVDSISLVVQVECSACPNFALVHRRFQACPICAMVDEFLNNKPQAFRIPVLLNQNHFYTTQDKYWDITKNVTVRRKQVQTVLQAGLVWLLNDLKITIGYICESPRVSCLYAMKSAYQSKP